LQSGFAAASIVESKADNIHPSQLRIAFDGDAVIFSDESEKIFQEQGLKAFHKNEKLSENIELKAGPLNLFLPLCKKFNQPFQKKIILSERLWLPLDLLHHTNG